MVIFHSYVSLPEGIWLFIWFIIYLWYMKYMDPMGSVPLKHWDQAFLYFLLQEWHVFVLEWAERQGDQLRSGNPVVTGLLEWYHRRVPWLENILQMEGFIIYWKHTYTYIYSIYIYVNKRRIFDCHVWWPEGSEGYIFGEPFPYPIEVSADSFRVQSNWVKSPHVTFRFGRTAAGR